MEICIAGVIQHEKLHPPINVGEKGWMTGSKIFTGMQWPLGVIVSTYSSVTQINLQIHAILPRMYIL